MELRHLRYFIAVAEHGSIRLAAEHIHVTQPAISRQIHDLESEIGFALFERTSRGLNLTPAGRSYLRDAREVLTLLDNAARAGRQIAAGLQGRLRLGYVENAGWDGFVPTVFQHFQRAVPLVRLELVPLNSPEQIEKILGGTLEGGFIYQYEPVANQLTTITVVEHGVVLAVPESWGLPDEGPVSIRSMADRPFILFPRSVYSAYYDRLIAACRQCGVSLNVIQEQATETAILSLVCSGLGAAIVNSANRGRPPALVRFLDLSDLSIPMPLTFAYRTENPNPILTRFLSILKDVSATQV